MGRGTGDGNLLYGPTLPRTIGRDPVADLLDRDSGMVIEIILELYTDQLKKLICEEELARLDEPAIAVEVEGTEVDWTTLTIGYRRYRQTNEGDLVALDPPGTEKVRVFSLEELLALDFRADDPQFFERVREELALFRRRGRG